MKNEVAEPEGNKRSAHTLVESPATANGGSALHVNTAGDENFENTFIAMTSGNVVGNAIAGIGGKCLVLSNQ